MFKKKKNNIIYVLDVNDDKTIQSMIQDASSKETDSYIKLEVQDIKSIIEASGLTFSISNHAKGENSHMKVIEHLISDYKEEENLKAILIYFTMNEEYPMSLIQEVLDEIARVLTHIFEIIISTLINNNLQENEIDMRAIIKQGNTNER